jgi:hypothetical protein
MIPNPRKAKQKKPGEGAFPLEQAKRLYAMFGESGQDMPFQQFYAELCGITDPDKMREDLSAIELARARERSNRLLIERGLLRVNR